MGVNCQNYTFATRLGVSVCECEKDMRRQYNNESWNNCEHRQYKNTNCDSSLIWKNSGIRFRIILGRRLAFYFYLCMMCRMLCGSQCGRCLSTAALPIFSISHRLLEPHVERPVNMNGNAIKHLSQFVIVFLYNICIDRRKQNCIKIAIFPYVCPSIDTGWRSGAVLSLYEPKGWM